MSSQSSNTQTPVTEHLLLIRGTHWDQGLSADEMQRVMGQFNAWIDDLVQRGVHRGAQPLLDEGRVVAGAKGVSVTDGAFAESKETIGGYFLLGVSSMDEAVRLAQGCPILAYGAQIEVRPIAPICRMQAYVNAMEHEPALA
jgi:hypothetical protein